MEGGGPYAYPDPRSPREVTGFEVEMMDQLAGDLGATAEFSQGQWDKLLQVLDAGRIDVVVNGYEWTETGLRDYLATRPYYVYQLQLMAPRAGPDPLLGRPEAASARRAAAGPSACWSARRPTRSPPSRRATRRGRPVRRRDRRDDGRPERPVRRHAARPARGRSFIASDFRASSWSARLESHGYYVIYVRKEDAALRDALDAALGRLIDSGELRRIYEKYGIWTDAQDELSTLRRAARRRQRAAACAAGWALSARYRARLLRRRVRDDRPLGRLDAAGDGARARWSRSGRLYGPPASRTACRPTSS